MLWWGTTENLGAYYMSREDLVTPRTAMLECKAWLEEMRRFGKPIVCGAPSGFDFTFIYYYFQREFGESTVGFASLDLRSYAAAVLKRQYRQVGKRQLPPEWIDEGLPHTHVALDDAIEQGCILINIIRANLGLPHLPHMIDFGERAPPSAKLPRGALLPARGLVPEKRHIQFSRPDGTLYAEELFSTRGFESVYSLLYHLRPPTATLDIREWKRKPAVFVANDPLRNRHFLTGRSQPAAMRSRRASRFSETTTFAIIDRRRERSGERFYRNVGGDELLFVHRGTGTLQTAFGEIAYRPHDYLVIPSGTTYRLASGRSDAPRRPRVARSRRDSAQIPKRVRATRRTRALLRARLPRAGPGRSRRRARRIRRSA